MGEIQWDNKKKTWNKRSHNLTCSNSSENSVGEIQWDNKKKTWNRRSRNLTCNNSNKNSVGETLVCVIAVDLRPQRIQSHSSNSIITATDSKHVATTLSLSAFPFLFLSLLLLLIDRRPQRIELHFLKTPLSCATDSKSHRENTYRKRPKKSLWRITKLTLTKTTSYHRLTRVTTGHSLLHRPFPSPTPQNLRHRQTDVVNLYIGLDF